MLALTLTITSMTAPTTHNEIKPRTTTLIEEGLGYKQLKKAAEQAKGSRLTLKEKVGLKLFGKKIKDIKKNTKTNGKGRSTALLLGIFLGGLGIQIGRAHV